MINQSANPFTSNNTAVSTTTEKNFIHFGRCKNFGKFNKNNQNNQENQNNQDKMGVNFQVFIYNI